MADVDYSGFTVEPAEVHPTIDPAACPPVGELVEPAEQPLAPPLAPGDEPLVPIELRGVRTLGCYFHAGWDHARPATLARSGVVERLHRVTTSLPDGFGLAVFDAWRPLELQAELHAAAYGDDRLPPGFIAEPVAEPSRPPAHLTGGAVDLTLTWRGAPLALGTGFDDFSPAAHALAEESRPGPVRDLRRLLTAAMRSEGFIVLDLEWWHFEWGTRRWAAIRGESTRYGPADPTTT